MPAALQLAPSRLSPGPVDFDALLCVPGQARAVRKPPSCRCHLPAHKKQEKLRRRPRSERPRNDAFLLVMLGNRQVSCWAAAPGARLTSSHELLRKLLSGSAPFKGLARSNGDILKQWFSCLGFKQRRRYGEENLEEEAAFGQAKCTNAQVSTFAQMCSPGSHNGMKLLFV